MIPSLTFYQACIIIERQVARIPSSRDANFQIPKDAKVHLEWLYGQACQFQKASIGINAPYFSISLFVIISNSLH